MGSVIIVIVLACIFLVISIFMLFGKGSWMIAGYNTASDKEKEQYDKKKLCRMTGITLLVVSILLFIMAYLGYKVESGIMNEKQMLPFAIIFIIVVLATVIIDIFYSNTKCINRYKR
jgi:preprotein translocase subunit SecG